LQRFILLQFIKFILPIIRTRSVFETIIRGVGGTSPARSCNWSRDLLIPSPGLLSARLLLPEVLGNGAEVISMAESMLNLAVDLANRLLPAFETATGIPYGNLLNVSSTQSAQRNEARDALAGTVNLLYGVPLGETTVSSLAGAGSNLLEFYTLSRASGNPIFGAKAAAAMRALWSRRSALGLYGNHIDVTTGSWLLSDSGVGTNSDSFVEYGALFYLGVHL
jgi:mannosidase alpha-like ER degradation enhancer 2